MSLRSRSKESEEPKLNAASSVDTENPLSYQEAIKSEKKVQWLEAMTEEYNSLMKHDSWNLIEVPAGVKLVKCRGLHVQGHWRN